MTTAPRAGDPSSARPSPASCARRLPPGADPQRADAATGVPALWWLADVLSSAGLVVHETAGWRTRAHTGRFEPTGVLLHHTGVLATPEAPVPSLGALTAGARCHVLVDRNGECWLVAGGRAHHAGAAKASGPVPAGDGSELYVGVEVEYAATSSAPTQYATNVQKSVAVVAAARIIGALGHDHTYVRAHKETSTTGRRDPFNWDMVSIRDSIRQILERTGWSHP